MKTKRIAVVMAAAMLLAVSPVEAGGRQIFSSVCVNAADNSSVSEKNEKMWLLKTYYRPNWEKGHDLGYNITYDKNGRISKITFVTYDSHNEEYDKKREYSVYKEIKIIYEKNNILNYIVEGEEYKNKYSVKYNDMGLITAVNGIRAYEYDEDGNAVEKKLKNSIANKYDKNGKLIYSKETSSYYITQNWYSYDESGRLTHKTWKQVNRETARENIGSTNYKYDENGNIVFDENIGYYKNTYTKNGKLFSRTLENDYCKAIDKFYSNGKIKSSKTYILSEPDFSIAEEKWIYVTIGADVSKETDALNQNLIELLCENW